MKFHNNGVIIQDIDDEEIEFKDRANFSNAEFEKWRTYRSTGRYANWPLKLLTDQQSKQLTAETEKWFINTFPEGSAVYYLATVPDRELCIEYLEVCKAKGINTRLLFCRSEWEKPFWGSELPEQKNLGYDYVSIIGMYSSIPWDLLDYDRGLLYLPIYQSLLQCKDKLNEYGLFSNEKDIITYIELREKAIEQDNSPDKPYPGRMIDTYVESLIIQVSEVIGKL